MDVLVPAALENQITHANAPRIHGQVRVVLEAANGPMTAEANEILEERGVLVIPDILANAGGVTCSYFEQVQGNTNYYWSGDEVLRKLDGWMTEAFAAVHHVAERDQTSLRNAAYSIAIERVARACRERGWVRHESVRTAWIPNRHVRSGLVIRAPDGVARLDGGARAATSPRTDRRPV